jgi:hypothetical protein
MLRSDKNRKIYFDHHMLKVLVLSIYNRTDAHKILRKYPTARSLCQFFRTKHPSLLNPSLANSKYDYLVPTLAVLGAIVGGLANAFSATHYHNKQWEELSKSQKEALRGSLLGGALGLGVGFRFRNKWDPKAVRMATDQDKMMKVHRHLPNAKQEGDELVHRYLKTNGRHNWEAESRFPVPPSEDELQGA